MVRFIQGECFFIQRYTWMEKAWRSLWPDRWFWLDGFQERARSARALIDVFLHGLIDGLVVEE